MLSPKPAFRGAALLWRRRRIASIASMARGGDGVRASTAPVVRVKCNAAPARADDDFIRRRLRGRHAADRFDDRFRDLLSYGCVSASLGEPGDPTNDDGFIWARRRAHLCVRTQARSFGTTRWIAVVWQCGTRLVQQTCKGMRFLEGTACILDEWHSALLSCSKSASAGCEGSAHLLLLLLASVLLDASLDCLRKKSAVDVRSSA